MPENAVSGEGKRLNGQYSFIMTAATLLFVHGLGDDASAWDRLIGNPKLDDLVKHAYTIPGFGGRPWSNQSIESIASEVAEIVKSLDHVVLVGHSLGGVVGTVVSEEVDSVLGFVNIEGNLTSFDCGISGAAVDASDFDSWFQAFASRMEARYSKALSRSDTRAFRSLATELVDLSTANRIGKRFSALRIPTLMIHGTDGYPRETIEFIRAENLHAISVDAAGHWVLDDASEITANAIRNFSDDLVESL